MALFWEVGCGRLALLAAMGVLVGASAPAQAADLGGNCCADLEERIAELEATTVRKGNRKVKLEVSGQINEAVMFWDDGFEDNAYVVTNDNARTRFRFKGEAKIEDGWKAGYLLEVGVRTANSKRVTQDNDTGNDTTSDVGLDIRHSVWYIDSVKYGRLWVGLTGGAAEGVTEINLAATKDIAKYSDQEDFGLGMALRQTNGLFTNQTPGVVLGVRQALTWRRLIRDNGDQPGEGRRSNLIRYDTPEIQGFTGTVNWGEDDFWEVGLRYKGDIGPFQVAAGIAYGENKELKPGNDVGQPASGQVGFECLAQSAAGIGPHDRDAECNQVGGSISVMHLETGLYANFAAGRFEDELIQDLYGVTPVDDTSTFYAVEVGLEHKWFPIGKTTLFGQYYKNNGGANARRDYDGTSFAVNGVGLVNADVRGSELESFGVGIVQGIDAAAMHTYLTYRHYEADVQLSTGGPVNFEDLDVVMSGAIIRF